MGSVVQIKVIFGLFQISLVVVLNAAKINEAFFKSYCARELLHCILQSNGNLFHRIDYSYLIYSLLLQIEP